MLLDNLLQVIDLMLVKIYHFRVFIEIRKTTKKKRRTMGVRYFTKQEIRYIFMTSIMTKSRKNKEQNTAKIRASLSLLLEIIFLYKVDLIRLKGLS